jgi:hypothetical protein
MRIGLENLRGVLIGAATFLIIGAFHPLVKLFWDYQYGWLVFLIAGLAAICASLFVRNVVLAAICGVLGFTCLWSIHEIKEHQEKALHSQTSMPAQPSAHTQTDTAAYAGGSGE